MGSSLDRGVPLGCFSHLPEEFTPFDASLVLGPVQPEVRAHPGEQVVDLGHRPNLALVGHKQLTSTGFGPPGTEPGLEQLGH